MRAVSLLYHDVVKGDDPDASGRPGSGAAAYKLDADEFDRHIKAVAAQHRRPAPSSVYEFLEPRNNHHVPFFLTFDNGGVSAAVEIADALEKIHWRGHFFVTGRHIGETSYVSSDQIRALASRGHIIGSHSWSHPDRMAKCNWQELMHEWRQSLARLSDILGVRIATASVPGGYFCLKVAEAAAACGIRALFTSEPVKRAYWVDSCLVLGRYTLHRGMTADQAACLASPNWNPEQLKQYCYWNLKKLCKRLGGRCYLTARGLVLKALPR